MAEVIPQINIDGTKIKNTWVQNEVVTNDVYNAINKAVINLKDNNNLLDSNAMLFREEYNSSSKNLNNAIHQGVYSFTNSAVNAPSGVNGGNLFVTNTSKTNQGSSIITQIAFCHNGAIYIRTKNTTENFTNWILVSGNTGGIKNIKGSNDTLTITNGDNSTQDITINNIENSTKAKQDSTGQTINTTYVKGVTANNATLTITKGNGSTSSVIINNVKNANTVNVAQQFKFGVGGASAVYRIFARTSLYSGDSYGNSTFIITSTGDFGTSPLGSYIVNISNRVGARRMYVRELISDGSNSTTFGYYESGSYFYFGLMNTSYSGECSVTPLNISSSSGHEVGNYKNDSTVPSGWQNVTIEKLAPKDSPAFSGTPTAPTPSTSDNSTKIATTAFVNNYAPSKTGTGASGAWNITANKANQDSDGNTITTTYLKRNPSPQNDMNACTVQGIYRFDGELKNAWTSTAWGTLLVFNNNYNGGSGTAGTYLVQMAFPTDGRIWTRQRANTEAWGSWYCTAYTYSPAFSGSPTAPTPATTDNSTRVATTAFVRNLLGRAVGKTQPTLTALIDWETMKSANGGTDVRNINNTTYGVIAYGGDVRNASLGEGNIFLKQDFNTFDAILINYTDDSGSFNDFSLFPMWEFYLKYNTKGSFDIIREKGVYWRIRGNKYPQNPSTLTKLNVHSQNGGIIEIYGVTY